MFFVLVVAAAEVVVGLGIIVAILRRRPGATADDISRAEGLTATVLDLVWLIPALPAGRLPAARWSFGRRLGEPLAGWLATADGRRLVRRRRASSSSACSTEPASERARSPRRSSTWIPAGGFQVDVGFLVDPLSITMVPVRHRHRHADPPVLDRLHARRPEVLEVLPLPEPVRLLDADAGAGRQPAPHLPRLGGRRRLLVLPHLVLVHRRRPTPRPARRPSSPTASATGASWSPCSSPSRRSASLNYAEHPAAGRRRLAADHGHRHRRCCSSSAPSASRPSSRCTSGCPTPWPAPRRSRRSSTPPPWSPPASTCMTRMNPVHRRSPTTGCRTLIAWVGVAHRAVRRHHRRRPERHQEGAGLLDGQPARLHVPGRRRRRLRGRHLPHDHPRLLQGPAVPRLRLGHPRHARRAGHAPHGRPAQAACRSPPSRSSSAGWPSPASRRSPASGRRTRSSLYAYDKSPVLWAIGLVTALLTAFYMSRQVFMIFFGEPRWDATPPTEADARASAAERAEADAAIHGDGATASARPATIHPHESPWTMTLPLVVLAVLAVARRLPQPAVRRRAASSSSTGSSRSSSVGEHHLDVATRHQGRAGRRRHRSSASPASPSPARVYLQRRRPSADELEQPVLAHGWYYDAAIAAFMGGPGPQAASTPSPGSTARRSTAPSTASAAVVRRRRSAAAPVQTGYVRNYALGIAVGAVAPRRLHPRRGRAS